MKNQEEKQTKTVREREREREREKREREKNKAQVLFWICLNITFTCIVPTTVYKCKFTSKETTEKRRLMKTNQENEKPEQAVEEENETATGHELMKTR